MVIDAPSIRSQKFKLYGVLGEFMVAPSPNNWKICHFSVKASNDNDSTGGNCLSLLKELKPMRERIDADKISDMASLLQRDLSDYRVANDLVPYLMENQTGIGFFPGVLVALMPKGFLVSNDDETKYPDKEEVNDENEKISYNFDNYWHYELFKVKDNGREKTKA